MIDSRIIRFRSCTRWICARFRLSTIIIRQAKVTQTNSIGNENCKPLNWIVALYSVKMKKYSFLIKRIPFNHLILNTCCGKFYFTLKENVIFSLSWLLIFQSYGSVSYSQQQMNKLCIEDRHRLKLFQVLQNIDIMLIYLNEASQLQMRN